MADTKLRGQIERVKNRSMTRIARLLAFALALPGLALSAHAQDRVATPYAPVIVVNDQPITVYELSQRTRLLEAFGAGANAGALAEQQLIDNRLQVQAGKAIGIELDDETITRAAEDFAQRRELTAETIFRALGARGVDEQTFRAFVRAGATWREVVQARFRRIATPTESDLDAALSLAQRGVQESVLLREIGIPFEERGQEASLELARRLSKELNRGGNFGAAVARYSRTPSAARGGRLNWLPTTALPGPVAAQVLALQKGEVTAPIQITRGVSILQLLDVREEPLPDQGQGPLTLTYSQLIIPVSDPTAEAAISAARTQAEKIRREAELCSDLDARADEFGIGSGRSEPTPVNAVPADIGLVLSSLEPGDKDVVIDERGVRLIMLCARSDQTSPEAREALRRRLFNRRMVTLGQGYLQELRGDAVIERR